MKVERICEQCSKRYECERHRIGKSRFCSTDCQGNWQRTQGAERKRLTCEACRDEFVSKRDHGAWPRFCSRPCFLADCLRPEPKECAHCGTLFVASKTHGNTEDGRRKYCSVACRHAGLKRGEERSCVNCGAAFYVAPSTAVNRPPEGTCSNRCKAEYYRGSRSGSFKTGASFRADGEKRLLMRRPGYVGNYVGEHRIIASRAIGRLVLRTEPVLRVNQRPTDNRPDNLFVCGTLSEAGKRCMGSLPWPTRSNLGTYR